MQRPIPEPPLFSALLAELDGTPREATWTPIAVEIADGDSDSGDELDRADVPWLWGGQVVLRDEAIDRAGPILAPYGELLPLACETAQLALFHPTQVLDALDEDQCQVERFPSSGRIMAIERYAFRPERIPEHAVFRIPQGRDGPTFFTEAVVEELGVP